MSYKYETALVYDFQVWPMGTSAYKQHKSQHILVYFITIQRFYITILSFYTWDISDNKDILLLSKMFTKILHHPVLS